MTRYRIGCAGWSLPIAAQGSFPGEGTHLARYAGRLGAVEINSSFYRAHAPSTYEKWATSVPADFRFAVKVPRAITHDQELVATDVLMEVFLSEVRALGPKLGCLLVQLPPKLGYDAATFEVFIDDLRGRFEGSIVLEPRHASWFSSDVDGRLRAHHIARVAADPAVVPAAAEPGGWRDLAYFRLHGSPRMYYSSYDEPYLDRLAERLHMAGTGAREVWCIFDNTASGAAVPNALDLSDRLAAG